MLARAVNPEVGLDVTDVDLLRTLVHARDRPGIQVALDTPAVLDRVLLAHRLVITPVDLPFDLLADSHAMDKPEPFLERHVHAMESELFRHDQPAITTRTEERA